MMKKISAIACLLQSLAFAIDLPPPHLRFRVAGTEDASWFASSGESSLKDHEYALAQIGKKFSDFEKILEWGCGCGRIIRHMSEIEQHAEIYGCDIDAEAIHWATENIPFAVFSTCNALPPTLYPDNYFDLIINHSVMTHLDEYYQDQWLAELKRILKPNGIIILSVHGETATSKWLNDLRNGGVDPTPFLNGLNQRGIHFYKEDSWGSLFPDFYHTTFHRTWYIFEHWGQFFQIKAYLPQRGLGLQDYVVMKK